MSTGMTWLPSAHAKPRNFNFPLAQCPTPQKFRTEPLTMIATPQLVRHGTGASRRICSPDPRGRPRSELARRLLKGSSVSTHRRRGLRRASDLPGVVFAPLRGARTADRINGLSCDGSRTRSFRSRSVPALFSSPRSFLLPWLSLPSVNLRAVFFLACGKRCLLAGRRSEAA